jgi:hypothetical protein
MKKYLAVLPVVCMVAGVLAQDADIAGELGPGQVSMPPPPPQVLSKPADLTAGFFYDSLRPHGAWMEVSPFGIVWQPAVAVKEVGWRPYYSCGRWVWVNSAWTWSSDYEWGWAPFHYGKWVLSKHLGWIWIPGLQWGPAWVVWNQSVDEFGWAPMPPEVSAYVGVYTTTDVGFSSWGFQFSLTEDHYVYAPYHTFGTVHFAPTIRHHGSDYGHNDHYRQPQYEHRTDHPVMDHPVMDQPRSQSARVQASEPSRRTSIMQQVVMQKTPSASTAPRQLLQRVPEKVFQQAPQKVSTPAQHVSNIKVNSSSESSSRRSDRLQSIIARVKK